MGNLQPSSEVNFNADTTLLKLLRMKVEGSSHVHVLRSSPSWPFGQREVAVPYRWGRVRLCKRYGVICTATPRHPGRPIMSHARAGRCATGVHRCFMRPGISTLAVRGATARRVALARGRVASFSSGASAAADDQDPPCRLKSGWLRHRRAPPH